MKYRDIITVFVGIVLILALAYSFGVRDHPLWFWIVPIAFLVLFIVLIIKLWL